MCTVINDSAYFFTEWLLYTVVKYLILNTLGIWIVFKYWHKLKYLEKKFLNTVAEVFVTTLPISNVFTVAVIYRRKSDRDRDRDRERESHVWCFKLHFSMFDTVIHSRPGWEEFIKSQQYSNNITIKLDSFWHSSSVCTVFAHNQLKTVGKAMKGINK